MGRIAGVQHRKKEKVTRPNANDLATLFTYLDPERMDRPTKVLALPVPMALVLPPKPRRSKHDPGNCGLTDKLANKILSAKRGGLSDTAACEYAGANPTTFSQWLNDSYFPGEPYATFRTAYAEAKVYPKIFLLDAVLSNAYADGKLALDLLARLEPETYAKVIVLQAGGTFHHTTDLAKLLQDAQQRRLNGGEASKVVGNGSTALVDPRGPRPKKAADGSA
jgi:hypothetical protein